LHFQTNSGFCLEVVLLRTHPILHGEEKKRGRMKEKEKVNSLKQGFNSISTEEG
jgi:hypothetical protein